MKWQEDLVTDIRTDNQKFNDQDHPLDASYSGNEFTKDNYNELLNSFLRVRDDCVAVLEIGVCRNKDKSSTWVFLKNKKKDTFYFGIDLQSKSFLDSKENNIVTIKQNSSNIINIMEIVGSYSINQFDFIFIDGWHSINQVLADWEYTKYLGPNGIVGFHDVNHHPGPKKFIESLDRSKWNVDIRCPNDWGIAFTQKRKD